MAVISALRFGSALGLCLGLLPAVAGATTITVANNSFEAPNQGGSGYSTNSITSWNGSSTFGVFVPTPSGEYTPGADGLPGNVLVPDGTQAAYVNVGNISQTLTGNTLAIGTYVLTVYVGQRADLTFGGATIELLAGGMVDDSITPAAPGSGQWKLETLTDVVTASDGNLGQTLGIELTNNSSGGQVDYDLVNLSFTPLALPLPGALSLFAGGLALMTGLTGRRRRKRQPRVA